VESPVRGQPDPRLTAGAATPGLHLIETLRYVPGQGCPAGRLHLARLAASVTALGWDEGEDALPTLSRLSFPDERRVRLTRHADGSLAVMTEPAPAPRALWRLGLAAARLASDDPWLAVKSSRRAAYDAARLALPADLDEAILLNERGEVCDGTITTLFFDAGGGLCTPPVACGVLPGVLRGSMLATGACRVAVLAGVELPRVRLWVGNSLRGLAPAVWCGPQPRQAAMRH